MQLLLYKRATPDESGVLDLWEALQALLSVWDWSIAHWVRDPLLGQQFGQWSRKYTL